jgi:hypothetical protein
MGTIGVSRNPQARPERGGHLAAEETGAVDAITLKPTIRARKYGKRQLQANSLGEPVIEATPLLGTGIY